MDKRDFLRSLGFQVGERGRFSAEMLEALKDWDESQKVGEQEETYTPPPQKPKRGDGARFYVAELTGGQVLKFDTCPSCKETVVYCDCRKVSAPEWLAEEVVKWTLEV